MNITEYNKKTRYLAPLASAVLKDDYHIISADEYLYKFLDKNASKKMIELLHPDDRTAFHEAAQKVDAGIQYELVRLVTVENNYKYVIFSMKRSKNIVDGVACIEVFISDIIAAMEKHVVNRVTLNKYRRLMCLIDCLFFDYVKGTNRINIYMYANDKSYMLLAEDLDIWESQMLDKYIWKEEDKKKFETFCIYLRNGLEDFKMQFCTKFFSRANRYDSILALGSIMFDNDGGRLVSGIIKLNAAAFEKPYYVTEASKDSATGLMNKKAIMEYSASKLNEAGDKKLSLFVMDIDNFKQVNDNYGHLFGDKVIFRVAETIKRIIGIGGTVARFGGDEFVVLLENCDTETRDNLLKTIHGEVRLLFASAENNLNITMSVGVSNYPEDGNTYAELFEKADKALYIAKANGKNNYVIYDHEKHKDIEIVSDTVRMSGLKSIASRVNRSVLYSDIVLMISGNGMDKFSEIASKICDLYDVSGIAVYAGDDLERKYAYGKYRSKAKSFTLLDDTDFAALLNEDDIVVIEDVKKYKDKKFYEKYNKLEIMANLVCVYRVEGIVKAIVTFDNFNTSRQWTDSEVIALNAVGKLIGQSLK